MSHVREVVLDSLENPKVRHSVQLNLPSSIRVFFTGGACRRRRHRQHDLALFFRAFPPPPLSTRKPWRVLVGRVPAGGGAEYQLPAQRCAEWSSCTHGKTVQHLCTSCRDKEQSSAVFGVRRGSACDIQCPACRALDAPPSTNSAQPWHHTVHAPPLLATAADAGQRAPALPKRGARAPRMYVG